VRGGRRSSVAGSCLRVISGTPTLPTTLKRRRCLGAWSVDLREHRPYAETACFAPCVVCDKEGASEQELEEQLLQDKFARCGIVGEELSQGSVDHPGDGPPPGPGQLVCRVV
jgi:hypothetical protein